MPPPPPDLPDELLGEVFLRLPPDDHECLRRASLTCKRWRRVIADPAFRRRHWELHGIPSAVGFLRIAGDVAYISNPDADRVTLRGSRGRVWPLAPGPLYLPGGRVLLDCRHGRVLFSAPSPLLGTNLNYDLIVWDPLTKKQHCLPRLSPPLTDECGHYFNAAVLCSTAVEGCDYSICHGDPFCVAAIWNGKDVMCARMYSSKTDNWSDAITVQLPGALPHVGMLPCRNNLVGDSLYFYDMDTWEYQLGAQRLSIIDGPPPLVFQRSTFLVMPKEDGGLRCMNIKEGLLLQLWSREAASDSEEVARWTRDRAIDLEQLLPDGHPESVELLAYAEGTDVIFVGKHRPHVVYMVQLNSGRARKVSEFDHYTLVFPYTSFCIPVIDASSTTRGPGHDASSA